MSPSFPCPDCAGEWEWIPDDINPKMMANLKKMAKSIGLSVWWTVTVTENPTSGRMCKELRMGGSALCGFADWSGEWRKV